MEWTVRRVLISVGALIAIGMVSMFGCGYTEEHSRSSVQAPAENRRKFSDVFVLLDRSPSMRDWALTDAKQIVRDQIIPSIGVNDRIVGYTLGAQYNDNENVLFGKTNHDQPGKLADAEARQALSLYTQEAQPARPREFSDEELSFFAELRSTRQGVEAKQKEWQAQLDSLKPAGIPGSNYHGALDGIKQQLKKNTQQRDTWLFIVGDLINASTTLHPDPEDVKAFKDVKIVLVYPFESQRDWEAIKQFWKGYFGDNFEERTFGTALREQFLLPPNPTFGVEIKTGEKALTLMRPFLIADVVIILICMGLFFFAGGQTGATETRVAQGVENNPTTT